jgi:wyosine [tRNA(Phe)-imidazoG37] synthetase (radical SAM superfamily)
MEKDVAVLPLKPGIIYGPVNSRRLGRSLGINLSPVRQKLCSFNCIYCHYGWTERLTTDVDAYRDAFPSQEQVLQAVRQALESSEKPDYITFSGDGEPTLHPDFSAIVGGVRRVRDEVARQVPLAILTNSSTLGNPSVREGLEQIDRRICKLDAGTEATFQALNGPAPGITLGGIVKHLCSLDRVTIQTIFLRGTVDNTGEENLAAWIALMARINPEVVQIYSTDRPVPQKGIKKVSRNLLKRIAALTKSESGVPVSVYSLD